VNPLTCLLANLVLSYCRHADTNVLSLVSLKRLALSARVVPSEPRPQPSSAESLPVQVEEGLAVSVAVEESAAPSSPAAATVVGEERVVTEMTAPKLNWSHRPRLARVATTW
jgi:hypothetical protein